jgi:hypothetical protein
VGTVARPHVPSLVGGLVVLALGVVLLLDGAGAFDLSFATLTPIACAAVGAILLSAGLSRGS